MDINKLIAKREFEAIGGNPQVFRYWDKDEKKSVDIFLSYDRPYDGVSSYATIGLSKLEICKLNDNSKLCVEIVGASDSKNTFFANIIASTAFEIMESKKCGYGHIVRNVISEYISNSEMKHVYLMAPFLWDELTTLNFEGKKVTWLLIIPISDQEKDYAMNNGWEALETKFEEANIDIFNLYRKSIL